MGDSVSLPDDLLRQVGLQAITLVHDFNNSLAAILGYAEFLVEDLEPGTLSHTYASRIVEASLKSQAQVEELRRFIRDQSRSVRPS